MRSLSKLNIYYRLLILILGTSGLFFVLYLCLYFYTLREEKNVYGTASKEYNNEINSVFHLNSKMHISSNNYVSFWDELVDFIKTRDKKWYNESIVSEFEAYESDYIGIYNLSEELIAHTASKKIKTVNFIPKSVFAKLYKDKILRFYLQIPEGTVEVFASTIHPTSDPKRNKFKPSGYFFMIRILDGEFIQNLEAISSSKIKINNHFIQKSTDRNSINATISLNDWNDKKLTTLVFERPFSLNFHNTKKILVIIIIATIINLLIYLYYYTKWVFTPLNLITNILETKDENSISNLKKLRGEFIRIAHLFEENNKQRKLLEIAKHKAEESDKLKSSFLANLSHEIRTPMNAIMGFSDLLINPNLSIKERDEYLKIIRNSGKNLTSIIEDLLEMSKIDSKQITPNYKAIDLEKCISDLHKAIKITIPEEKELTFSIKENLVKPTTKILSDEVKLKQILTNLITNAIKFTKKGNVSLGYEVNEETEFIELWVEDTGQGIEKSNLQVVFDRFRRIEDEFSVQVSGLGLGLSITKAYIELLGGTINVESEIGKGSKFSFTIPLKYDETVVDLNVENALKTLQATGTETILVAEDDDINFMLLERILLLKNYTIIRAVNGKEAVQTCKANPHIDLIFMDIKMPVMDGFEAFKLIRTFNKNIPIVANTAYSSTEDKENILTFGFNNYLSKPINKTEIFDMLDDYFGAN
jgi:signal transduction histidine kinase/CheY-like chemotaxis protein